MSVSNETKVSGTGIPSRSIAAVKVEVIVESAAIVDGLGEIEIDAEVTSINVDWLKSPIEAVILVVPVLVPGVKVMMAYPCASVMAVLEDKLPNIGVAEKVTV